MAALQDFTPLQGGVPITVDGKIVGGVGVSGAASALQDEELAIAAASALSSPSPVATSGDPATDEVFYLASDKVQAAFARGMPLSETGAYKVHASRRDANGLAEVHEADTDIVYVLEGTATLVTGGAVVNGKVTGEGERRGQSIAGGTIRRLVKGDVVIVPNGVPHLFRDVTGPFLYYVVKVTGARRSS
jgi:mannose-6-phosphate isomerase-like protein (cupin superfamily)